MNGFLFAIISMFAFLGNAIFSKYLAKKLKPFDSLLSSSFFITITVITLALIMNDLV